MNNNRLHLISTIVIFLLFVSILFYSYTFKLGYFPKATYLIFSILIGLIILNTFKNIKNSISFLFWTILLILFVYAFVDKILHLHNILGDYINLGAYGGTMIQTTYLISFLIIMLFFNRFFTEQYNKNSYWLYLFIFAYFLSIAGVISDFMYHNKLEDYFELFSLYFFAFSFLLAYLSKITIKNENSNLSPKS